jgi:deoxyribose-phosphate aldolase
MEVCCVQKKGGGEAQGHTLRRTGCVAREKATEIDYVYDVGEILSVDLKACARRIASAPRTWLQGEM